MRNGAKWEIGHIAIYLTKRDGGGELGHSLCRGSGKREGFFWKSDGVCVGDRTGESACQHSSKTGNEVKLLKLIETQLGN